MKLLKKYGIVAMAAIFVGTALVAQDNQSTSSAVRKRSDSDNSRNSGKTAGGLVTDRMQAFFEQDQVGDADLSWMRVIYRQLDLDQEKNAPLYYPEEPVDNQQNLFRIIMGLLADNRITAYEYLDGREVFTDQYKLNVKDMLDRFHILYTEPKESTEKNPKFTIEESDVPSNEVLSYYMIEQWNFDSRSNRMRTQVKAICPVLHRTGDFGGDAVKYPMFWIVFDDLRPFLSQQYIFVNDDNNLAQYNYDDFFQLGMYQGDIYKTRNLQNKSMMQMYPDPDDLKHAQDSIQQRLDSFDDKLWVPTREELLAAREAKENALKQAENPEDSTAIASRDETKSSNKASSRTSRAKKKPAKVKESKVKSSSSSTATRSVRNRK